MFQVIPIYEVFVHLILASFFSHCGLSHGALFTCIFFDDEL